jgi:uncharacterized protein
MNLPEIARWMANTPTLFEYKPPIESHPPFKVNEQLTIDHYNGNLRLGFIYQHLCKQLFQASGHYCQIAEEVVLNEQGRTVGSIDFILENKLHSQSEHWEVAIKFYLLHQGAWYGPNAQDRLDIKLNRMLTHQLTLSQRSSFRHAYPQWSQLNPHLLMQGRLYTNPFNNEFIPAKCLDYYLNQSQINGCWCYQHQARNITEDLYLLQKSEWMIGTANRSQSYQHNAQGFVHCQSESGVFWFIVPDHWPAIDTKKAT